MNKYLLFFLSSFWAISGFSQSKPDLKIISSTFIYEDAPFPECHASTLLETEQGILAAWFGGTYERHPDASIYISHFQNGVWSVPKLVADGIENQDFRNPTWNPVLLRMDDGKIVLFYKEGPNPQEWWGLYKTSADEGKSWSKAVQTPPGFLGPVKNKSIRLKDGSILHPSSFETNEVWTSHVERTDSNLENWQKSPIPSSEFQAIQPTILIHSDEKLQVLCRTQEGVIASSWSVDFGETWTALSPTSLVHNNSGIDGVTLENGYHLLVCNPIRNGRNKLSILGSADGENWEELLILEDGQKGEFSYPAIIQSHDGLIHISYTYEREKIKYVQCEL